MSLPSNEHRPDASERHATATAKHTTTSRSWAARTVRTDAIAVGAIIGVVGVPLGYFGLSATDIIVSDPLLIVCLVLPTLVLLLACLIRPMRGWALQAAAASAIASLAFVAFVFGGINLIASMLSDPIPAG